MWEGLQTSYYPVAFTKSKMIYYVEGENGVNFEIKMFSSSFIKGSIYTIEYIIKKY